MEYIDDAADSLWDGLDLGSLLIGKAESYDNVVASMTVDKQNVSKSQAEAERKYVEKISKPNYSAVIDRYNELPSKPTVLSRSKLNRLADPVKGRWSIDETLNSSLKSPYKSPSKPNYDGDTGAGVFLTEENKPASLKNSPVKKADSSFKGVSGVTSNAKQQSKFSRRIQEARKVEPQFKKSHPWLKKNSNSGGASKTTKRVVKTVPKPVNNVVKPKQSKKLTQERGKFNGSSKSKSNIVADSTFLTGFYDTNESFESASSMSKKKQPKQKKGVVLQSYAPKRKNIGAMLRAEERLSNIMKTLPSPNKTSNTRLKPIITPSGDGGADDSGKQRETMKKASIPKQPRKANATQQNQLNTSLSDKELPARKPYILRESRSSPSVVRPKDPLMTGSSSMKKLQPLAPITENEVSEVPVPRKSGKSTLSPLRQNKIHTTQSLTRPPLAAVKGNQGLNSGIGRNNSIGRSDAELDKSVDNAIQKLVELGASQENLQNSPNSKQTNEKSKNKKSTSVINKSSTDESAILSLLASHAKKISEKLETVTKHTNQYKKLSDPVRTKEVEISSCVESETKCNEVTEQVEIKSNVTSPKVSKEDYEAKIASIKRDMLDQGVAPPKWLQKH